MSNPYCGRFGCTWGPNHQHNVTVSIEDAELP